MQNELKKGDKLRATFSTPWTGAVEANAVFDGYFWDGEEYDTRYFYIRITEGEYQGETFLVLPKECEILVDPTQ